MLYESSLLAVELSAKTSANAKGWARLPAVTWSAFGPAAASNAVDQMPALDSPSD